MVKKYGRLLSVTTNYNYIKQHNVLMEYLTLGYYYFYVGKVVRSFTCHFLASFKWLLVAALKNNIKCY